MGKFIHVARTKEIQHLLLAIGLRMILDPRGYNNKIWCTTK